MAVDQADDHGRLPCGNTVDALLVHMLSDRPTVHDSGREYCRVQAERPRPLATAMRQDEEEGAVPP